MNKLLYALKNNQLVSIDEVDSGLKCCCICPACGQNLVAKKGKIKTHHFSHKSLKECEYAYETSLHLLAKEIFKDAKKFLLPEVRFDGCNRMLISESKLIDLRTVQLEQYMGNIKPDIIIEDFAGNKYFIEIYVTHAVDEYKLSKISNRHINTIEINLSKVNKMLSYDDLKEILLNNLELKRWVYSTDIEDAKREFAVPTNKLNNCILQRKDKTNFFWCYTHCKYGLNISKDNSVVYCERAKEVLAGYRLSAEPKFCRECGCKMDIEKEEGKLIYKCTGFPQCKNVIPVLESAKTGYCPVCNSKLVLRRGYSSFHHRYNNFWGCSNYPNCNYTEKY